VEGFSIFWLERSFCCVLIHIISLLSSSYVCFGICDDDDSLLYFLGLVGDRKDGAPDSMQVSGRPPVRDFPTVAAWKHGSCSNIASLFVLVNIEYQYQFSIG